MPRCEGVSKIPDRPVGKLHQAILRPDLEGVWQPWPALAGCLVDCICPKALVSLAQTPYTSCPLVIIESLLLTPLRADHFLLPAHAPLPRETVLQTVEGPEMSESGGWGGKRG